MSFCCNVLRTVPGTRKAYLRAGYVKWGAGMVCATRPGQGLGDRGCRFWALSPTAQTKASTLIKLLKRTQWLYIRITWGAWKKCHCRHPNPDHWNKNGGGGSADLFSSSPSDSNVQAERRVLSPPSTQWQPIHSWNNLTKQTGIQLIHKYPISM